MSLFARLAAGLAAGAAGFFGGLYVLLSVTGLDRPGWAPVAMLTGASLLGSAAVTITAKLRAPVAVAITAATTGAGAIIGAVLRELRDSYEWVIAAGVLLIVLAAMTTQGIASTTKS